VAIFTFSFDYNGRSIMTSSCGLVIQTPLRQLLPCQRQRSAARARQTRVV